MFRCLIHPRAVTAATAALMMTVSMAPAASAQTPSAAAPTAATTPRLPNGKPDLSGVYRGGEGGGGAGGNFTNKVEDDGDVTRLFPSRRCVPNQVGCRDNTNQANDYEFTFRTGANRPMYKPEHWDKVQFLDYDTNFSDPMMKCLPLGTPRIGPPAKIVATETELMLFYGSALMTSNSYAYRIVPMNAKHDPDAFPTFYGDSIGYWDGDTLVIETVSFNDQTWLTGQGGYFHSYDLKVFERFTRNGNNVLYEVTVEDPTVLLQPWKLNTRQLALNPNPNTRAILPEGMPCQEIDSEITVSRIRH